MQVLRLNEMMKQRIEEREFYLSIERIKIADFRNSRRTSESDHIWQPEDIFKLSFDSERKTDETNRQLTFKEAKQLFGSRIKKAT
jgi:hypothetical protein